MKTNYQEIRLKAMIKDCLFKTKSWIVIIVMKVEHLDES